MRTGTTRPFVDESGKVLASSIAEVHALRLGGIEQWVMIRGRDRANPVLVLLHGGPGMSEMPLFRTFNAELEDQFTVVYWDQRGAGKSFSRKVPKESMTVEQFIADLDELVEWVRVRLACAKVVILGHSWGTVLGVLYCARFPEKVTLYVGGAQIGDWNAGEEGSYAFALEEARKLNNEKALKALQRMGPPPHSAANLMKERVWIQRMEGALGPRTMWGMLRTFGGGPERSLLDIAPTFRGFRFSLQAMWPELSTFKLLDQATELRLPAIFFLGRQDHWVPPEVSVAFIDELRAPSKEIVWFEESGHEMFVDEPEKFNATMLGRVRELVLGQTTKSASPALAGAAG